MFFKSLYDLLTSTEFDKACDVDILLRNIFAAMNIYLGSGKREVGQNIGRCGQFLSHFAFSINVDPR
jgi:hypothetical protein